MHKKADPEFVTDRRDINDLDRIAGETARYIIINGKYQKNTDIAVSLVSATQIGSARFEVTVIADPRVVNDLLKSDAKDRLKVASTSEKSILKPAQEMRCSIRQLHGGERITIEIPCQN
ncbi:MAG: hypothetical protein ABJN21_02905 [Paracoccaceae bacterium]